MGLRSEVVVRIPQGRAGSPARRGDGHRQGRDCRRARRGARSPPSPRGRARPRRRSPHRRPMTRFNLSALAVRERAVTLFLIITIAVAGAYAFVKLGRAEDPSFTIKVLTVTTVWPGATAQEMQDLVAEPLEKRVQELRWYDRVEKMPRPGLAFMTLTGKDSTPPSDGPEEFYQARKKLGDEARNLPSGALGPFVNDEYSDVTFALYALKAPGMAPRLLTRQAETIRQQLLHVPGVKKVNILGERPERIFVEFSYPRLATLGISAQDIFAALQRQNAVTPAGSIDAKGPQVFVRLDGAYDDLQKIADTPIVAGRGPPKTPPCPRSARGVSEPPPFLTPPPSGTRL